MNESNLKVGHFFSVMGNGQAYLNLLYLLVAFPLGIFYFIFLVSGLSLGISLSIIWVGIPLLVLMGTGWWLLAKFERYMAIHILKEDVPEMILLPNNEADLWTRLKEFCTNPVAWKSLLFLFLKLPLGMVTFVILVVVISLTLVLLSMPFTFQSLNFFQGISLGTWLPVWQIDSLADALVCGLIGFLLWPVSLHITNILGWAHGKFAKMMLG